MHQTCMTKVELNLTIYMRYIYGANATSQILSDIKNSCNYISSRYLDGDSTINGCPHVCNHYRDCITCWGNAIEEFVLTGKDVPQL